MNRPKKSLFIVAVAAVLICAIILYYYSPLSQFNKGDYTDSDLVRIIAGPSYNDPTTVTLRVPNGIRYGSAIGAASSDYFNIITHYPAFDTRLTSDQTLSSLNCNGYCDGRITVSLSIIPSSWVRTRARIYYDEGAGAGLKEHKPIWSQTSVVDRASMFGFNTVFDIIKPRRPQDDITRYFVNDVQGSKISDIVVGYCSLSTPFHGCRFSFVLDCYPELNIDIGLWPYEHLSQFIDLKEKVSSFVELMIVEQKCHKMEF